jgi:predicted amino acid-binding ACT domain protein
MTEIILINLTGRDRPGITRDLSAILARHGVRILDIGQAVIHDTLTLGILIGLTAESVSQPVVKDVLFKAHEWDLQARFTPIEPAEYERWVKAAGDVDDQWVKEVSAKGANGPALLEEARALAAQLGQQRLLAFTTSITGYALADLGRYAESAAQYRQCLQMSWDSASWREWFYALWNLPRTLAHLHRPGPAAQLMGFAEAFYAERFGQLGAEDLPEARRTRRLAAALLGREATTGLWRQGAAMSMAEAMQLALEHSAPAATGG